MPPLPITLLGLVFLLGPGIQAQKGNMPRPSISVEPGSVVPWGARVTFVCHGPPGAYIFRLEKEGEPLYTSVKNNSGTAAEARFLITSVNKSSAGHYCCLYYAGDVWSERSELLELMVTAPSFQNYIVKNSACIGLAAVVLLILVVILAEAWHSKCRSQHGPWYGNKMVPVSGIRLQDQDGDRMTSTREISLQAQSGDKKEHSRND